MALAPAMVAAGAASGAVPDVARAQEAAGTFMTLALICGLVAGALFGASVDALLRWMAGRAGS